jgi:uncharacterized protein
MNTTEHVTNNGQVTTSRIPNKLAGEKSPYLLQHTYNPVHWYPWGEEAFTKAKEENKPIFLSIGYSTCHWCHVMAHESFEDTEVARILNDNFIAIKVDKEERPDIDNVYMSVCQKLTGSGGWPLSIFMTYDQKPFFAGTYFPKQSRYQSPGFIDLMKSVKSAWDTKKDDLFKNGENIIAAIQETQEKEDVVPRDIIEQAITSLKRYYDKENGGFGRAPKFPTPHNLYLLLRYAYYEKDQEALSMIEKTLDAMYRGGIFDHIGFGFCRYSTDSIWLVPHFEKMLYDNGLLAIIYLEAFQYTKKLQYGKIAERILTFVSRELTHKEGGFFCALDADSEGVEGKFYVYDYAEAIEVLGKKDGTYFNEYFNITKDGNFEGKSIPNRIANIHLGKEIAERSDKIESLCDKMYQYRLDRTKLHIDDKVLTSWNGIMIAAFAKAYAILGEFKYLELAVRGEAFIQKYLIENDKLKVTFREGESKGDGHLDDYAYYCYALINLYEASYEAGYLKKATSYARMMVDKFFDKEKGGFYLYSKEGEQLIHRPKEIYDGAIPSGNSVAVYCLDKLAALTGDTDLINYLDIQLKYLAGNMEHSMSHNFSNITFLNNLYPARELVCVNKSKDLPLEAFLRDNFMPDLSVIIKNMNNEGELNQVAPFTKDYAINEEKASYYLCERRSCKAPVYTIDDLKELLNIVQ